MVSSVNCSNQSVVANDLQKCGLDAVSPAYSAAGDIQGLWIVSWLCVLEYGLLWVKGKPLPPAHENLMSIAHSLFYQLVKICTRSVEYTAYFWLFKEYALFSHWFSDSVTSFVASVVLIDLGYYWFHRISHEVAVFWAFHQIHHLSMDQTVTVGLRHSPFQSLFSWIFYLPLAILGMPPSHLLVHLQLNLMFQTWLHTCSIDNLGVLEYVFNTPSHHRVHHGSTAYCLDKNYAGIFIFWDYVFGSFQKELEDVDIIYGILYPPDTWNIITNQFHYMGHLIEKAKSMTNWMDFIHTFWKGPSWMPGSSRTGRELHSFYENQPTCRPPVNRSSAIDIYVCIHLLCAMIFITEISSSFEVNSFTSTIYCLFIMAALTNVGVIYEGKTIAAHIEFWRCAAGLIFVQVYPSTWSIVQIFLGTVYFVSFLLFAPPLSLHKPHFGLVKIAPMVEVQKEEKKND